MDLVKIGNILRELRKEKGLTQEQLAEQLHVGRRTVSRWETGRNMPDLDVLIELSDRYEVSLREILSGERQSQPPEQELEETVLQAADYSKEGKDQSLRRLRRKTVLWLALATLLAVVCLWRFWPHQLAQIAPVEPAALAEIRANAFIVTTDGGGLKTDNYTANFAKGEEGWSEILWLLSSTAYRQDLRNPFSFLTNSFSVDGDKKSVTVSLHGDAETDQYYIISFLSDNLVSVIRGDGADMRLYLYHPADRSVRDRLTEYIQKYGESLK